MASFTSCGKFRGLLRTRIASLIFLFFVAVSSQLLAQTCSSTSTALVVHAEGLAEPVGNISVNCSGGTVGSAASLTLFVSLNTNITNRLDTNSLPTGITVTGASVGSMTLSGTSTVILSGVSYTIAASAETISISGLLAAIAPLSTGSAPSVVTATVTGVGAQFPGSQLLQVGVSMPSLLSSVVNNGVPCNGSPLPATLDFPTFAATTISSELRVTEASPAAFTVKTAGADNGLRILVNLAGYGSSTSVYVPDFIVGNDGTGPTTAGGFATGVNGGTYTPTSNQLLLVRVNGADVNGAGGTLAFAKPTAATSFSTVTQVPLTGGVGFVAYEVVDSNPGVVESAHIPVFIVVPQTNCPSTLTPSLSAELAPVSHVAVATMTDPIPRFVPVVPALDCSVIGDCGLYYYPNFTVNTNPLSLTGSSMGASQSAFVAVGNTGSGILNFSTSIVYPTGSPTGWLTVSPSSGSNNVTLQVIANPSSLAPGTYTASLTVSAAPYGTGTVPITFTVGPVGVTVLNIGNAASFQYGTVAPGSYAVIFGLNLVSGTATPSVTFNGLGASVVYSSATQINLIVPASLGGQQAASVIVTAGGLASNAFKVNLVANSPGIFNPGIVNDADGSINGTAHPAARGSYISVYLTGLSIPASNVTVNIGSQTGLTPQFAGAQPTLPALDQVNVLVPASLGATPNPVPLQVCVPGSTGQLTCSNQINLYIQ